MKSSGSHRSAKNRDARGGREGKDGKGFLAEAHFLRVNSKGSLSSLKKSPPASMDASHGHSRVSMIAEGSVHADVAADVTADVNASRSPLESRISPLRSSSHASRLSHVSAGGPSRESHLSAASSQDSETRRKANAATTRYAILPHVLVCKSLEVADCLMLPLISAGDRVNNSSSRKRVASHWQGPRHV